MLNEDDVWPIPCRCGKGNEIHKTIKEWRTLDSVVFEKCGITFSFNKELFSNLLENLEKTTFSVRAGMQKLLGEISPPTWP